MKDAILRVLKQIEDEEEVFIFFACESGSRAWGFPSADSDYDVRFLYLRPLPWYLSINVERRRDVIERPITDELDVSGWDLRKALWLFQRSNPPLHEWLHSPIIYLEKSDIAARLRALAIDYYAPKSCFHHYLSMAHNSYKRKLRGDTVQHKAYFYVLRPLLACQWIADGRGVVPTAFGRLHEALVEDPLLDEAITALLRRKRAGLERHAGPPIPVLSAFIEAEMHRLTELAATLAPSKPAIEPLNALFRDVVTQPRPGRVDEARRHIDGGDAAGQPGP